MRLTHHQIETIRTHFATSFPLGDRLWLFGSRINPRAKGGDIDLYIETHEQISRSVLQKKMCFLSRIKQDLGDQKIDVVINMLSVGKTLPIYGHARSTGIMLMHNQTKQEQARTIANLHAERLFHALEDISARLSIDPLATKAPLMSDIYLFDTLSTRFCKLQDLIGATIFRFICDELGDPAETLIDRLNLLEKHGYLESASWWLELRALRNELTHNYPLDDLTIAATIETTIRESERLYRFWTTLEKRLANQ